jgi:hypothetical protein
VIESKINVQKNLVVIAVMSMASLFSVKSQTNQTNQFKTYSNEVIEKSERYEKGNSCQKDFLLFVDILRTTHPAFAPNRTPPFDIDSVEQKGYVWAENCTSENSLKSYLQSIATILNDGHTTVAPTINKDFVYPFVFFKVTKIFILWEYQTNLKRI